MANKQLWASAVEFDITPPIGDMMEGYGAREGVSQGIHDPLLGRLLLLQSGEQRLVLVGMDLLGVGLEFTQRVRAGIEQAIGVPADCTLLACTHTHSGAGGILPAEQALVAAPDPELQRCLERKLLGAARWARERLQPARLGVGHGSVDGIGRNRNDPQNGVRDDELLLLRLDDASGQPLAVLINYGCHPTVLGPDNRLLSADYPGAARAALRTLYPSTVFVHTNGASGDVSTRFTRREQTFAEAERMGRILAGETLKVMQTVLTRAEVELAATRATVDVPLRRFPAPDQAQRELQRLQAELATLQAAGAAHGDIRRATTRAEGATAQAELARRFAARTHIRSEVQILHVGDVALVGLPGEPFTRTVLEIKAHSPSPHTAVVSYANDEAGYFPDGDSISQGTYEALSSPYGIEGAEMLRDTALHLLRKG
jgi:hypothetical protein